MRPREIVVGTRASRLAQAQTDLVVRALQRHPGLRCEIHLIQTSGDRFERTPLPAIGGKGLFTKEIEEALLAGEIDLAVHSLKDLPTELPQGLVIGAVLERADPRDVFILRKPGALPQGAVVGTSSLRRSAQLKAWRSDLRLDDVRGNVETRLRKLDRGGYDAIVLAAAGLERLGYRDRIDEPIPPSVALPAVGQGALAVEVRADNTHIEELLGPLDHRPTRVAVEAERAFLQKMGGGCRAPIAAYAQLEDGRLRIDGMVAHPDGSRLLRASTAGDPDNWAHLVDRLTETLFERGAEAILAAIRDEVRS